MRANNPKQRCPALRLNFIVQSNCNVIERLFDVIVNKTVIDRSCCRAVIDPTLEPCRPMKKMLYLCFRWARI